jgi:predicted dehydrogenase
MEKMHVGILGAGNIAGTMAKTLTKMEGVCFYAIASRSLEKAKDFAGLYGAKIFYGSYEEMLQDEKVDLVYIATPHSEHFANMKSCISYGKPILCEKSFTANAEQAEEIIKLAEEKGVFVTEAIWTRYMPMISIIKKLIDEKNIGKPIFLSANMSYPMEHKQRLSDPMLAAGALLDVGVYTLNFAAIFFGDKINRISSICTYTDTGMDRSEAITLIYDDGRMACLNSSQSCVGDRKGIIHGTLGYLVIENINNYEKVVIYNSDHKKVRSIDAPRQISGYEYEVEACRTALLENRLECPEMPHEETIRIMHIMDKLRKEWGVVFPFEK